MAAPVQAALITPFPFGVSSFGMPVVGDDTPTTGRVFFVDSTSSAKGDDTSHGNTPQAPFATLDFAIGQCTANRGDRIYVLPGHIETITSAAGINCDVAGVQIFGIGQGRDRAKITLASSTAASIDINAQSVWLKNLVIDMTGIDQIGSGGAGNGGIRVKAADARIEGNDLIIASASNQVVNAIGLDTNAHRCRIIGNRLGGTETAGPVSAIDLYGAGSLTVEGIEIGWNIISGDFSAAGIQILATDNYIGAYIHDNIITNRNSGNDCLYINAGSSSAGVVFRNHFVGPSASGAYVAPTAGWANIQNYGYDIDTTGVNPVLVPAIGTDLPTNSSLVDQIVGQEFSARQANYLKVSADFSLSAWKTVGSHEILTIVGPYRVIIIPECTSDLTSGGAATIQLGDEVNTAALIASTTASDIDDGEFWLTTTPAKRFAKSSVLDVIVSDVDLGYEIGTAAMTGGGIDFHMWVIPLSTGGTYQAGLGSSL